MGVPFEVGFSVLYSTNKLQFDVLKSNGVGEDFLATPRRLFRLGGVYPSIAIRNTSLPPTQKTGCNSLFAIFQEISFKKALPLGK